MNGVNNKVKEIHLLGKGLEFFLAVLAGNTHTQLIPNMYGKNVFK